jgi:hypothetical protein
MTGHENMFSELDQTVQGIVKFGDGSMVNICGKDTVILSGRHGEQDPDGCVLDPTLEELDH